MAELRTMQTEIRSPDLESEEEEKRVSGLGIVYDQWTDIIPGRLRERINKGAAKPEGEIKSYFNHDPNQVLATNQSEPALDLQETDAGVMFSSPIPPTSYGRDLEINLERRNVKGASFAFRVPEKGDRMWEDEDGVIHREINELYYFELGPVTDPAYVQTTAHSRSADDVLNEYRQRVQAHRDVESQHNQAELELLKMKTEIKAKELI